MAARPQDLHDRFVLSEAKILLVGHGLKDIGAKESFVIVLPRTFAPDLLDNVRTVARGLRDGDRRSEGD